MLIFQVQFIKKKNVVSIDYSIHRSFVYIFKTESFFYSQRKVLVSWFEEF